jgi:L-cysteine/cystine lyase
MSELRANFPVLHERVYLNAGTDGPLPQQAFDAAQEELARELAEGRTASHFERRGELATQLRSAYALALGAPAQDVALTTCTTEGLNIALAGLGLSANDEVLTSDEEHPGLLGALQTLHELHGVHIRMAPFESIHEQVSNATTVVVCSHVSWINGSLAPAQLASLDVPVILDGAQGVGAVAVDVTKLGVIAYAGSGQKWLCGPDGTGMLYVAPDWHEQIAATRRGYGNYENPGDGMDALLHKSAARFDTLSMNAETAAAALAATRVLAAEGWPSVFERAAALAESLATRLEQSGREVAPRDQTTLVAFSSDDPAAERERLAAAGILLRDLPNTSLLRASVGAWNDEQDIARLLAEL